MLTEKNKRKSLRRPVRYTAWIALKPDELRGCVLSDISDTGARIGVDNTENIPDRFVLYLSKHGTARRACTVVWREPRQLGVSFMTRPTVGERDKLTPKTAGDVASPPLAPDESA